jgi:hypothetical protein
MNNVFVNTGTGPCLVPIDIGHALYKAVVEPDMAFWSLVRKDRLADPAFASSRSTTAAQTQRVAQLLRCRGALPQQLDQA